MSQSRAKFAYRGSGRKDPVDVHVGRRLRSLRRLNQLSQTALGRKVGVTFQQIQKYEGARNRVSASRLWHLARALDTTPAAFFAELPE